MKITVLSDMFEENDSFMVKKKKLFALPKFGSLRDSTSASLKIDRILAIHIKIGEFLTLV